MSATDRPQKISIGFSGGQALSARVRPAALTAMRAALPAGGWHDLTTEDGTVAVDLAQVVFLLVEDSEHRVGF